MTIHPRLAPLVDNLDVAYMASAGPQRLDIVVETAGPGELPLPLWTVLAWARAVSRGLGGGSVFPPESGLATVIQAPDEGALPSPLPARWELALEITAVCPTLVRALVEGLAGSGYPHPLTRLSVFGSLPLTDRALSLRGAELGAWLRERRGFPERTAALPFSLTQHRVTTGLTLRVDLRGGDTNAAQPVLEDLFSSWQDLVLTFPRAYGPERGVMAPAPAVARTRSSVRFKLPLFDHLVGPAEDLLLNGLAALRVRGMPIEAVAIGTP